MNGLYLAIDSPSLEILEWPHYMHISDGRTSNNFLYVCVCMFVYKRGQEWQVKSDSSQVS